MISDTERREIARKLREIERHTQCELTDGELIDFLVESVGFNRYTNEDFDEGLLGRIADLIDRPKAKREDAGNYWLCGHCGAFSRKDAVTDCCGVIPSRCCGNCGREWER